MENKPIIAFAFQENDGEIDLESISNSEDNTRINKLESSMGWRFRHPDRYSYQEEWERLLKYGRVVRVEVSVVDAGGLRGE